MPDKYTGNDNGPGIDRTGNNGRDARDPLIEKVIADLDDQAQYLDAATVSRLNQVRQAVMESMHSRQRAWTRWGLPVGLATTAAAGLVAVALWTGNASHEQPGLDDPGLADLALLTSEEGLDFYENLEFYQWLETELDAG